MTSNIGLPTQKITNPDEKRGYSPKTIVPEPTLPPPGRPGMSPSESTGSSTSSQDSSSTGSSE